MNEPVIALHGLPGAGKDTLAEQLHFEFAATRFAFADLVYEDLAEMFDTSVECLRDREWKTRPQDALALWRCGEPDYRRWLHQQGIHAMDALTSRFHLQKYGTDYRQGREGVDYWAQRLRFDMDRHVAEEENTEMLVVSDLRRYGHSFHELDMLRAWAKQHERPLIVVQVTRDGAQATEHPSDAVFPPSAIDLTVHNTEADTAAMFRALSAYLDQQKVPA